MRRLLIFGFVLYALFVASQFPAAVAVSWFAPQSVTVHGAQGSIWSGEAEAIETGVPGLTLGRTNWRLRPFWLLTGRLRGELHSRFQDSAIRTRFSKALIGDTLKLSNTNGILNLGSLPRNVLPLQAHGRVGVSFDNLHLVGLWPHEAKGSVDLVDVEIVQGRRIALGSFEIVFDGDRDEQRGVVGTVADTDSTLEVKGQLSLGAERSYLFDGVAKAGAQTPADIAQGLQFLGTPDADGRVALSFSGTVP